MRRALLGEFCAVSHWLTEPWGTFRRRPKLERAILVEQLADFLDAGQDSEGSG